MRLISVPLARSVSLLEIQGADPYGRTSLYDGVGSIASRYSFQYVPKTLQDLDLQKGIEFALGKLGSMNIDKMTLFNNGVVVDTHSATVESDTVTADLLSFIHEAYGSSVSPTRQMHLSHVVFESQAVALSRMHACFTQVASRVSELVSIDIGQKVEFTPTAIGLGADLSQINLKPANFTLERRADTPFSANLYFSAAPIQTQVHLDLLEYLESNLK